MLENTFTERVVTSLKRGPPEIRLVVRSLVLDPEPSVNEIYTSRLTHNCTTTTATHLL